MVFTEYCGAVYTNYIGSTQALELLKLGTDNLHEARRLSAETKVLRFITPGLVEGDDANHRQGGDKITDGEVGELWYSMCSGADAIGGKYRLVFLKKYLQFVDCLLI